VTQTVVASGVKKNQLQISDKKIDSKKSKKIKKKVQIVNFLKKKSLKAEKKRNFWCCFCVNLKHWIKNYNWALQYTFWIIGYKLLFHTPVLER
jgi:hypothetical protein